MAEELRCPDCGSPPHLKHLRNCKSHGNPDYVLGFKASRAQIDLMADLIKQLGHDEDNYNLDTLNSVQASTLIQDLLEERG